MSGKTNTVISDGVIPNCTDNSKLIRTQQQQIPIMPTPSKSTPIQPSESTPTPSDSTPTKPSESTPTKPPEQTPIMPAPSEQTAIIPTQPPEQTPIMSAPSESTPSSIVSKPKQITINDDITPMTEFIIKLKEYKSSAQELADADDITTESLLTLVQDDNFCIKVAETLKNIYTAKLKKYETLQQTTQENLKNDNEMAKHTDDIDRHFPMIAINTKLLKKLKTLSDLASSKLTEINDQNTITMVRNNLISSITDENDGIVSITGKSREKIRNQLCKTLYILTKGYRAFMNSFLNIVFTGPVGFEKTKLAKTYAFVFKKSGILLNGDLIIASPKDMIGEYLGHTAIKSANILMKGLEGVILIDEAHQIMPCDNDVLNLKDSKSFGPEAITEIVEFLHKYMGLSIMIVAGYEKAMENCFFGAEKRLSHYFPNEVRIPEYSNIDILNSFINEVNARVGKNIFENQDLIKYVYTIIDSISQIKPPIFANQDADIMTLASMFLISYYGTKEESGDIVADIKIVNGAFNHFLRDKKYLMVIE